MRQVFYGTKDDISPDRVYVSINTRSNYLFLYKRSKGNLNLFIIEDLDTQLNSRVVNEFLSSEKEFCYRVISDLHPSYSSNKYCLVYEFNTEYEAYKYVAKYQMVQELLK